jgi:hypothetical protein
MTETADHHPAETIHPHRAASSAHAEDETRRLVRRLAHRLCPVVVDCGAERDRFETHLELDPQSGEVLLAPLAVSLLAASVGRGPPQAIRSVDPEEPWLLRNPRLVLLNDRVTRLEVMGLRVERMPERRPVRPPISELESLTLTVHAGEYLLDDHVLPIVDLGAAHCTVASPLPLDTVESSLVEIADHGEIVRRARATLVEVIPWVTAQGDRYFRCRLSLVGAPSALGADDAYDRVSGARVRRLLTLAQARAVRFCLGDEADGSGRIAEVGDDSLTVLVERWPQGPPLGELQLGFDLFGTGFRARARVRSRADDRIELDLPLALRRHRQRREVRVDLGDEEAMTLQFRDAASGRTKRGLVRDLCARGLCFELDGPCDDWKQAKLEDARLEWSQESIPLSELQVRHASRLAASTTRCHVSFREPGERTFDERLLSCRHPGLALHHGEDFDAMVDLYNRAGLLTPYMQDKLRPARLAELATDWRALHDRRAGLAFTLLSGVADGAAQGAVTCVRAWEHSWLLQHLGVAPGVEPGVGPALQLAATERMMESLEADYICFFVSAENFLTNAGTNHFARHGGSSEVLSQIPLSRWICRPRGLGPDTHGYEIRAARKDDEQLLGHAAKRVLGPLAARALSMAPEDFALPEISRRFARSGLERRRLAFVLSARDGLKGFLVGERTSPGVNLTMVLNAWWLLPARAGCAPDQAMVVAAMDAIVGAREDRTPEEALLLLPGTLFPEPFAGAGVRDLGSAIFGTVHRAGIPRFRYYLASRRGEVEARMGARTSRSTQRRP